MRNSDGKAALTLMCRDHATAQFVWDSQTKCVVGKLVVIDGEHMPFGARDKAGTPNRASLRDWLVQRGVPALRPGIARKLRDLGIESPVDLLMYGHGASLSDQFWLKSDGESLSWAQVSPFVNDFPTELGRYLIGHDAHSSSEMAAEILKDHGYIAASPDTTLGGNLPKRWDIDDKGRRVLMKGGHAECRYQEPFNELFVTLLCHALLEEGDYVPYRIGGAGWVTEFTSNCDCMCDDRTQLVPAIQILSSHRKLNDESYAAAWCRIAEEHGIDVRESVEKMLVVDYLVSNFDRHWNNFGILVDSESGEWLRGAPLFDNGECLWCDRKLVQGFGEYRMRIPGRILPFRMRIDSQLEAFCTDLRWFEPRQLDDMVDQMRTVLGMNPLVAAEPGRIDGICRAFLARCETVERVAAEVSKRRMMQK